jgi:hypothetical protein
MPADVLGQTERGMDREAGDAGRVKARAAGVWAETEDEPKHSEVVAAVVVACK